jgi:hypothetical protein
LAQVHDLFQQSEERVIEEVRPKILATGTSNMNMYHSLYEGNLMDSNMATHYKGKSFVFSERVFMSLV